MPPLTKEQLTGLLVNKLTGLEVNSPAHKRAVQKVQYTLQHDKCTSTSEEEVNNRMNRFAEKFSIKGHRQLSKSLLQHKAEFLKKSWTLGSQNSNQSILKYDMLQLLLSLSSSADQVYGYIPQLPDKKIEKELSWEEVVKDDPLEGDHWQTWREDSSNDDISDEDGYEFEEDATRSRQISNQQREQQQQQRQSTVEREIRATAVNYVDQMDIDNRGDPESLGHLLQQQYWRDDFSMDKNDSTQPALLQNPCQMSDALGKIYYSSAECRQLKTIPESGMIREVICLLRGYGGVIFKYKNDQFQYDETYIVQHLSQNAMGVLLNEFCIYGNIISELRQIVTRVAQDIQYGQTSQAFAAAIHKSLTDFDGQLSQLEMDSSFITKDPTKSVSILKLRNTLDSSLQCFKAIHEIAIDTPFPDANPQHISVYLISSFYDRALAAQLSGQSLIYDTLLDVLEQLLVPYGRMIDDWMFYGSLAGDRCKEFYVCQKSHLSITDTNFWQEGFYMEPVVQSYSCFPCPLFDEMVMSRIFFTGKAVNLLFQIEKSQKHARFMNQTSISLSEAMSQFLTPKPPFIPYTRKEAHPSNGNSSKDTLIAALFPMKNMNRPQQAQGQAESNALTHYFGSLFDQSFTQFIEKYIEEPYRNTAGTLTRVLQTNCRLPEQLKSLASIYLMLENDLMHSFCEVLFLQMDNSESWFDKRLLNSTFAEACEASGYDEVVYIELQVGRNGHDSVRPATRSSFLELVNFKVQIPWPLNNFIRNDHLANYSKILGFLLRLKRAKYVIEKKTLFRGRDRNEKSNAYAMRFYSIRMKILWFINAFWRYILTAILHAETLEFRSKLSASKDVDEITALHASYIRRIVDRCILNDNASGIKKSIVSIFDMAEEMAMLFAKYMQLEGQTETRDLHQFSDSMNAIEKDFNRANEFISITLMIMGKKGGLPWFETLATSLTANRNHFY